MSRGCLRPCRQSTSYEKKQEWHYLPERTVAGLRQQVGRHLESPCAVLRESLFQMDPHRPLPQHQRHGCRSGQTVIVELVAQGSYRCRNVFIHAYTFNLLDPTPITGVDEFPCLCHRQRAIGGRAPCPPINALTAIIPKHKEHARFGGTSTPKLRIVFIPIRACGQVQSECRSEVRKTCNLTKNFVQTPPLSLSLLCVLCRIYV